MRRLLALALLAPVVAGCFAPESSEPPGDDPPAGNFTEPTPDDPPVVTPPTAPTPPTRERPPPVLTRDVRLELVVDGLDRPLLVTHAGDGSDRLFILEKPGRIKVWRDGALADGLFANLTGKVRWGGEQGLLGLAFHPRFAENGLVYVSYTAHDSSVVVERYAVDATGERVDPASAMTVLRVPKTEPTHNGGTVVFGPDGHLYVSLGDGGGAGDPEDDAQRPETLFGSVLRLDVDGGDPYAIPPDNPFAGEEGKRGEVWDIGLRNPWRMSFDRETGDLWIGDVGQREREEVNLHPAGTPGGMNFGWKVWEGSKRYSDGEPAGEATFPVHEYGHDVGCAVAGGHVYRGARLPLLDGTYVFGDLCAGIVWGLERAEDGAWTARVLAENAGTVVSFGEDEDGEVYVVSHDGNGAVLRIAPADGVA